MTDEHLWGGGLRLHFSPFLMHQGIQPFDCRKSNIICKNAILQYLQIHIQMLSGNLLASNSFPDTVNSAHCSHDLAIHFHHSGSEKADKHLSEQKSSTWIFFQWIQERKTFTLQLVLINLFLLVQCCTKRKFFIPWHIYLFVIPFSPHYSLIGVTNTISSWICFTLLGLGEVLKGYMINMFTDKFHLS